MAKHGKKYTDAKKKIVAQAVLPVQQALSDVKSLAYVKFDESVDAHINLGIDPSKGEHVVRGSVTLPHGRGKKIRVIVFAKGDAADAATKAGADYVGAEDLVEKIKGGWLEFDFAAATPDLMGLVGQLAKILGPKGLLPNKKVGTVTFDVAGVVQDLKKGRVFFKNDKNGIVHFSFGKVSFSPDKLRDNLAEFVRALTAAKPAASKGKFLKKMTISSTMGVGIQVSPDELLKA
ncbi:MAG TPA: 50S ribosomal protein L1 [Candidatus Limnocylindria bacterium]|nr:50S ribosomal protein L1 [Candidatus Limnocylindria bacterium]